MDLRTLSVSELNAQIRAIVEQTFLEVCVEGEVSGLTKHTSGHLYFSLKDEGSSVRCVMFKGNARTLKAPLENGQRVLVRGGLSVYVPRGEYQIQCRSVSFSGAGELARAFEALKQKLSAKGYFDKSHKKPLPKFPRKIALLTSATGAAKEDMLKIAKKRWENVSITLFNTLVQGEGAKDSIVANLRRADSGFGSDEGFDVIVLGRGGGSMEDMWAFNEEVVADAIFAARTPIISAVGHEVDVFISDFVADVRAPTPSGAMELLLPDKYEWLRSLDELGMLFEEGLRRLVRGKEAQLAQLREHFGFYHFHSQFERQSEKLEGLLDMFEASLTRLLKERGLLLETLALPLHGAAIEHILRKEEQLAKLALTLEALNPARLDTKGYAQLSQNGKITRLEQIKPNEEFELSDTSVSIRAKRLE